LRTQRQGSLAEQAALEYLCGEGMRLLCRNFSCKLGEIDLIMSHRSQLQPRILVFVEVRYRQSADYGGAAASVTRTKRTKIIRTAKRFLQQHPRYAAWPCRFDVVAVTGQPTALNINWLHSAFDG